MALYTVIVYNVYEYVGILGIFDSEVIATEAINAFEKQNQKDDMNYSFDLEVFGLNTVAL